MTRTTGQRRLTGAAAAGLLVAGLCVVQAGVTTPASAADGTTLLAPRGTSTTAGSTSGLRFDGLRTGAEAADAAAGPNRSRSARGGRHTAGTTSTRVDGTTPGLGTSFTGLDITDNAKAAGFVLEPPDQGLCVGNGSVLELVNVVGRVYTTAGVPKGTGAFYLNDFFHENAVTANASDPSCYYDADANRFYADMLFYDSDAKGNFTGTNRIDIAVSDTGDPSGTWKTYSFDVTKDGPSAFNLGDYPLIGADREGIYITTNSYPFFENGFGGAQLYAMSKRGLAQGSDLRVSRVPLRSGPGGTPFTVRPTTSPASGYARQGHGTEFLLSSQAGEEAGNKQGFDQQLGLWALSGTDSLAPGASRALTVRRDGITVDRYGVPPLSEQKAGPYPLGQCLSDTPCRHAIFGPKSGPGTPHAEGLLDSSDSRMHQTVYAGGLVYGALDTVVNVGGRDRAGIAYYVVRPSSNAGGVLRGTVVAQGKLALAGNNLIYPAFGVTPSGQAVMGLNVVGSGHYPSAGYVTFDAAHRPSAVHVIAEGAGPTDGFTEYADFTGGSVRPRWGDYAATAYDAATGSIWMANEYVAQSCTLAQYQVDPTCGGTRSTYGNWSTRVSQVTP